MYGPRSESKLTFAIEKRSSREKIFESHNVCKTKFLICYLIALWHELIVNPTIFSIVGQEWADQFYQGVNTRTRKYLVRIQVTGKLLFLN